VRGHESGPGQLTVPTGREHAAGSMVRHELAEA